MYLGKLKGLYRPFFSIMANLDKLPTYFVKDGKRRGAYYTGEARELRALGWVEEGEKAAVKKPAIERQPEIVVEAGSTAYDSVEAPQEPMGEEGKLEDMTKAELLDWALEKGHDLKNALPKHEIFTQCKDIENSL